ncbi:MULTISPECIES: CynX/NimT family MFS transporter [Cryobacterium]|uniref:CynX/NimT family MFS transporter n=1 Tax=Cryobacterium TaxID=69578 RepID=UPI000B4CCF16|nr:MULTISPECIES: MFS transporter [Cryobacterium]ASD21441.1 MFS transporter [Cryobacterium sp. LW097]POH63270.1 MFS transporter [Cryobacterium zongtaii]TFC47131.1 MFS transporter [Cryobacterium sp. TMN-39-2]TFC62719.1 MFS transporter [Cryobacterium sp. TMB1-7]TFC84816.1 MFS transporter [Cryobacterium sp. TMT4-31]
MSEFSPRPLWTGRTLALLGIVLVAANLRTAVAALSPIVSQISTDIPLTATSIGLLGMLPPVCFAVFGIFTPVFTRRLGLENVLVLALTAMLIGHLTRGGAGSLTALMIGSVITFAGLGVGNVLLPPLVKKYFPDRVGLITSLYVTVVSLSTLIPPLIAVPVADAAGWRVSLGLWVLPVVFALVPWLTMFVRHRVQASPGALVEEAEPALLGRIWRSSIAWALAVVFAASSLNAYAMFAWLPQLLIDTAGVTPAQAGTLLSVYAAMGIPCALLIPWLTSRMKNVAILVYLGVAAFLIGDLGLLLAPGTLTWLWVVLAGLGPLFFPLTLVLINLRTRTHAGSVALSGFVQSVGYTLGALGPLCVALLHEITGAWTAPLLFLIGTALAITVAGAVVARPHLLEDDLERRHRS